MDERIDHELVGYALGSVAGIGSGMEMYLDTPRPDNLGTRVMMTLGSGIGGGLVGLHLSRSAPGALKGALIGGFLLSFIGYPMYRSYQQSNRASTRPYVCPNADC